MNTDPAEVLAKHQPYDWCGGLLDCSCGEFEDSDEDDYPTRLKALAEHQISMLTTDTKQ